MYMYVSNMLNPAYMQHSLRNIMQAYNNIIVFRGIVTVT